MFNMPTTLVIESGLLLVPRLFLIFACRKYIFRTLYPDLQAVSSDTNGGSPGHNLGDLTPPIGASPTTNSFPLDTLPTPSTAASSSKNRSGTGRTVPLHARVSRDCFAVCFSECCMQFILLVMQALDVFSPETRLLNWKGSIWVLMGMILVVIPLCVSLLVFVGGRSQKSGTYLWSRILISSIPVFVFLFAFAQVPLPESLGMYGALTTTMSRLVVLGTIILGLLSGFGAVSNSWDFLPGLSHSKPEPTDHDISTAEHSLTSIRNDLRRRHAEFDRSTGTPAQGTWFTRTFRRSNIAQKELQGLEALEYQMSRNIEAMKQQRQRAKFAGTFRGRLYNFCGRLFAYYCIVRVFSSLANVVIPLGLRSSSPQKRQTYPDLLTDIIATLLTLAAKPSDLPGVGVGTERELKEVVAVYVRQISLVLVGVIILTSLRLVLRGVTRALRVTSRNLAASLMLLLLAQLMGMYLLSTIVQLRVSFPPPSPNSIISPPSLSSGDTTTTESDSITATAAVVIASSVAGALTDSPTTPTNLFSTIPEYEVFGSLFDGSFLLSAFLFGALRWGAEKVNGADYSVV
ncbi:hypothetical protein BDN72DRAFT_958254 [Pluteus cervinus]|uniref:Uncharacterized protein n=1 Tax=Pluteus cervinus TaxID=181527 RepID=A0ACD3B018_9AGAR|nr:hypothetical protein BDN72DRAFT_958254 [Pluteus cervinus]